MPRDLLTSFLKQYLTTDNTFDSLIRKYRGPIKAIAFKPSEISDTEQQQLIQKLNDELSSLVGDNVSPNRTYRTMLQLLMKLDPKSGIYSSSPLISQVQL